MTLDLLSFVALTIAVVWGVLLFKIMSIRS